jgi:hypothetical protein
MSVMHRLRRHAERAARISAGLFVVVWLAMIATPCAIAMEFGEMPAGHDCPHCPPVPCHEADPDDCAAPDSLDLPRLSEKSQSFELAPANPDPGVALVQSSRPGPTLATRSQPRAGPPPYLLHLRFRE